MLVIISMNMFNVYGLLFNKIIQAT